VTMNPSDEPIEAWRWCWRQGFAPLLSAEGLVALRDALVRDDQTLLQGATTCPPPMRCVQDWPCEGACAVGFAFWRGDGLDTVSEIDEAFARASFEASERLGERAGCRHLLNFWDETPREKAREALLPEVELALRERGVT
jgi:hypothetical protein